MWLAVNAMPREVCARKGKVRHLPRAVFGMVSSKSTMLDRVHLRSYQVQSRYILEEALSKSMSPR